LYEEERAPRPGDSVEDQLLRKTPVGTAPPAAIRLLGGATIEQAGRPLTGRVTHRHALALLALLATAPARSLSRDKLLAHLWPEGETASIRHRLNVLLYDIRRVFGPRAITSLNGDLRLDGDVLDLDVARFLDAVEAGDHEAAIAAYGGPFLDGFHLPDAPEFEDWLTLERDRLARAARAALQAAATKAEADGDHARATAHWRRLTELDPLDAGATLGLMRALAALGQRAEALQAAERHARVMARDLEASPDPAVAELAARLQHAIPAAGTTVAAADPTREPIQPASQPVGRPRFRVRAAAVALVLLLPLLAGVHWVREGRTAIAGVVAPSRVVVLPFAVRGSERLAYLGEGLVDLLTTTLDGAGALRTADPHAVLSHLRITGLDTGDPEVGRQVAARFGAGHFVLGSIVESGRRVGVRATMYRADGSIEANAFAEADGDDAFFDMVDALTRQLLAPRYDERRDRLARLAVMTSASLPALKAWLDGEARYRAGDYEGALRQFREATREDSTFALSWYRLAVAAEWALQPHEAAAAVERAVRHGERLPERDRLLLVGWQAYAQGEAERAEAVYLRVLDDYPDEIEAWLQLGEIRFHYAASRGRSIEESRDAFERVLALEPAHEGARVHLARVAARAGDRAALARHVAALEERDPRGAASVEMRALLAFTAGDRAALRRAELELRRADSYAVLGTLLSLFYAGNLDGIRWCAALLAAPNRPPEVRTAGHLAEALVELARGRLEQARLAITRVEALDPARAGELRALAATLPFLPAPDPASLPPDPDAPAVESFFLPDHDGVRPSMRLYLAGLLAAARGDSAAVFDRAATLDRMDGPATDRLLPADLALGLRADWAARRGDARAALGHLDRIADRPYYQLVLPSPFHPRVRERYQRAMLMEETGRAPEAAALFATLGTRSLYDLPFLAPSALRLGGLYERRGDRQRALEQYRRFVTLWGDADPVLRPGVAAARERVEALTASPSAGPG
jgi:DNA-binding SARP family transcriptional activator/TolB-like protein